MCIYTRSTYNIRIYGGYVNDGLWKKRRDPGEKCVRVLLLMIITHTGYEVCKNEIFIFQVYQYIFFPYFLKYYFKYHAGMSALSST